MGKMTRSLQSDLRTSLPTYEDVAEILTPKKVPDWLPDHLKRWAASLNIHGLILKEQPSRAAMKKRMQRIKASALHLFDDLTDTTTRDFLESAGRIRLQNLGGLLNVLSTIADSAEAAKSFLSDEAGRTRPGPGRADAPDFISADLYCALLIAETWKFLRGNYPDPKTHSAAKAADTYWRAAGGDPGIPFGNQPFGRWRRYFKVLRKTDQVETRAEIQRSLREAARHQISKSGPKSRPQRR